MISKLNKFSTIINEKKNWSWNLNIKNNANCWYTDGSKTEDGTAFGTYNPKINCRKSTRISNHGTVMQAELLGISECIKDIYNNIDQSGKRKEILILTDSQAAIKALRNNAITSLTVLRCTELINKATEKFNLKIAWVPGHANIEGNIIADKIAREGTKKPTIEIEVPITDSKFNRDIEEWEKAEVGKYWKIEKEKLAHSAKMIAGFDNRFTTQLLRLDRKSLRVAVGIMTGHSCLNKFLYRIKKSDSKLCRFCKKKDEDMIHIITRCDALAAKRYKFIGMGYPKENDLRTTSLRDWINFAKETKIYDTFITES